MIFGPTERKTGKMHLCEVVCNGVLMKLLDVSSMLKLKKESKIDEFAWTKRFKNGHSVAIKTNRFQSGFRDLKNDRKKSGFRTAPTSLHYAIVAKNLAILMYFGLKNRLGK